LDEVKQKILESAEDLFLRLGVRSVTMEDVAREISISKKTIYQFFENKDHLVREIVEHHLKGEKEQFDAISVNATNAIDEIHQISGCMRQNLREINPTTLHDLRKYHPNAFELFTQFKREFILGNVVNNLERGIREGYYREDIDAQVLAIYRVEQVETIFDHKLYPRDRFEMTHVQMQLFDHFIYGLLTDSGRKLYAIFKEKEQVN
jgi:AcrR family transcriptional regulator